MIGRVTCPPSQVHPAAEEAEAVRVGSLTVVSQATRSGPCCRRNGKTIFPLLHLRSMLLLYTSARCVVYQKQCVTCLKEFKHLEWFSSSCLRLALQAKLPLLSTDEVPLDIKTMTVTMSTRTINSLQTALTSSQGTKCLALAFPWLVKEIRPKQKDELNKVFRSDLLPLGIK